MESQSILLKTAQCQQYSQTWNRKCLEKDQRVNEGNKYLYEKRALMKLLLMILKFD